MWLETFESVVENSGETYFRLVTVCLTKKK